MQLEKKEIHKDLVIVGAGMPGIVAAIQASRLGLDVALINDRGYLGGNASAEIRVPVSGADGEEELNFNSREGGILEEIRLENLYRNPQANPYIWDSVLRDFVYRESNIELFMETNVDAVTMASERKIESVSGSQEDSETAFHFFADFFIDDTGDGTIGFLAGAEYRIGREGKEEFGEKNAPDRPDDYVLPSTLTFAARDTGKPVSFIPPDFALDLTKTDILKHRSIPKNLFHRSMWFYELGGKLDQIKDIRQIVDSHQALVYGIWDHIKNSGECDSENYDLEYVSCIPGKRESRRLMGDYILKEKDIVNQEEFDDAVGHGGWAIDLHAIDGFFDTAPKNHWIYLKGIYQIPYRTGYSQNIENLFFVGRCISTTHVAFGSTRVMATLCTLAQAVGAAAYLCKGHGLTPRGVYEEKIGELQQLLLREDQYIPGVRGVDEEDKVRDANLHASSVKSCELDRSEEEIRGDFRLALVFPVVEHADSVSLLLRSDEETKLRYTVYRPDKRYNYSFDAELESGEITISPSQQMEWTEVPVHADVDGDKLILRIEKNESLWFGAVRGSFPGIITLAELPNPQDRILDVFTLQQKTHIWKMIDGITEGCPVHSSPIVVRPYNLCFRISPEQKVFEPENIRNGYSRPYGLPNAWVSDGMREPQWIEIDFDRPQMVGSLVLTFDSNLNCEMWNLRHNKDFNVMPAVVRDYRVLYGERGRWKQLSNVTGNYQRVNRLAFDKIKTDRLRIEFGATNGSPNVHLFEARVY